MGFGGYMFGAMTDAFYEDVHGYTKEGRPLTDDGPQPVKTEATPPPAPPAPDARGQVDRGPRCSVTSVGETVPGIGVLGLLASILGL